MIFRPRILSDAFSKNMTAVSNFKHSIIPKRYTADNVGISPPFNIYGVPSNTRAMHILVNDLDAPGGSYYHLNAKFPVTKSIKEGQFKNYIPPNPPKGDKAHKYVFTITALNERGDDIGKATIVGYYGRE